MARLLHFYPQFTRDYVEFELPMSEGWAFHSYTLENDGWLAFNGLARKGKGYVARETDKLMAMIAKR